jgi:predicted nucleic acid-binding protein
MKVYLDACCLGRLTDDQRRPRIAAEAEAVERILGLLRTGRIEWLCSAALQAETSGNPDAERRYEVGVLLTLATDTIPLNSQIIRRALDLEASGCGAFDALHLACAEAGGAEALLTAVDRFIGRAARGVGSPRGRVLNPMGRRASSGATGPAPETKPGTECSGRRILASP